jgi:hypothetical protein
MNDMTSIGINRSIVACIGSSLLACGAAASAQDVDVSARGLVVVEAKGDDKDHSIAIQIDNGDIEVQLDGKTLSADRIRFEDGRIVILDEDGEPIEDLHVDVGLDPSNLMERFDFKFGDEAIWIPRPGELPKFAPLLDEDHPPVMLGLTMSEPGPALRWHLDLEPGQTTMISGLYEGLPAHAAGLKEFDVIIEIEGSDPASPSDIREGLEDLSAGDDLELTVIQRGKKKRVVLELVAFDAETLREAPFIGSRSPSAIMRWRTPMGNSELEDIIIAPDRQIFRMQPERWPDMQGLEERLRKRLELQFPRDADSDEADAPEDAEAGRLEGLRDRMSEIETMLDRLLERIEQEVGKEDRD